MPERLPVIAIDGPAGAGKSTVARRLADDLGLKYLDTGAMYRALALKASMRGLRADEGDSAAHMLSDTTIEFGDGMPQRVLLDGADVTEEIRSPEVAEFASALSAQPAVRKALVARQKEIVDGGGVVLEGRDTTTVVAPEADVKVYLTASLEERARRRVADFAAKGVVLEFARVREDIEQRDHRDITREDSPLRPADDAIILDSANLPIDEVVARIRDKASQR